MPMFSTAKPAKKLNNIASKRSSSLIRSFSNVAIVTMFLQQQKSKLKNIWNIFPNLSQKSNFRAGCLKLSSAALSVLYYHVCCSPFDTSSGRQRASHTSLVWFRELEAVTNSTWQIFFRCSKWKNKITGFIRPLKICEKCENLSMKN